MFHLTNIVDVARDAASAALIKRHIDGATIVSRYARSD
jgi:hypothetical protein